MFKNMKHSNNWLITIFIVAVCTCPSYIMAQSLSPTTRTEIEGVLNELTKKVTSTGYVKIDSFFIRKDTLHFFVNTPFSYIPFRKENVDNIYNEVEKITRPLFPTYKIQIHTDNHSIESLTPESILKKNSKDKRNNQSGKNKRNNQSSKSNKLTRNIQSDRSYQSDRNIQSKANDQSDRSYQSEKSYQSDKSKQSDKSYQSDRSKVLSTQPLITQLSTKNKPTKGMAGSHIALWQSHGYYYESKLTRWEWQRARIFQTVEDLYTQSYVLPYLVPMLEKAGATVLLPRERDTQTTEIIIDNDRNQFSESSYIENEGTERWTDGAKPGFAHLRTTYKDFENPFKEGTYREIKTVKKGEPSSAEWRTSIPQAGSYAVYVAYATVDNSTDDALYKVYHKGGVAEFKVNQQMGGGTWIYLGHFFFNAGKNSCRITLNNQSTKKGSVLTADAVKIGGGYGNIARRISSEGTTENRKSSESTTVNKKSSEGTTMNRNSSDNQSVLLSKQRTEGEYPYETSGYPRFCEAARYWLQWAGVPDSIYSESQGKNDYTDDYKSRGLWVNYLSGGSSVNPSQQGLHIPIDLAFAFHTDAGTTYNDSIIGTLGIFETSSDNGLYEDGTSRYAARALTDLIQTYIVNDIRQLYEPKWTRRGLWNKSYYEARVPKVPTMLLELLSHQNFADMRYGLDPRFRFTVSRSIYKGILRFLSLKNQTAFVVQPLPVDHMGLNFIADDRVELTWKEVVDPLEQSAKADRYIVYTRIGNGCFDNGTIVNKPSYTCSIPKGVVCSFKVTAINQGGESFPSEILSVGKAADEKGTVLIVNGFDRISSPADFTADADSLAGFLDQYDHGVPYIRDISYIGPMKEFRRQIPWMDDDASGFGDSYATEETKVIAGNTFDYPSIHGQAILKAGYSFTSCSDENIEEGICKLDTYSYVDLILGKEYQTKMGHDTQQIEFKTFSDQMQKAITDYCKTGANLLVSGAFVGSDLWDNRDVKANDKDQSFATNTLKYKWRAGQAARNGKIKSVVSPLVPFNGKYTYYNELNDQSYVVESPDAIEPADTHAYTIFRYEENNLSAGIAYQGEYKTCVLGFPFESVRTDSEREQLMKTIFDFFASK